MKGKRGWGLRNGVLLLSTVLLLLIMTACSSSNKDSDTMAAANEAAPAAMQSSSKQSVAFSEAGAAEAEAPAAPVSGESLTVNDQDAVGGGIGPIADANAGFGRKVIYRADLVMKVKEFKVAEEQLLNLIHLGGAYVLQFSDSRNTNEVGATYVIKVPSEGFSPFLERLQKIKSLKFEREVQGNDVTEEFVDLDARLKAKQTVESRLLAFMDKATKTDDLVRFSNELANVQQEIEQIKGRIRFLDQNVAFSTINLRLYQTSGIEEIKEEKTDEEAGFGERIANALSGSAKALRVIGEGILVVIAALLPVLVVVAVIGIPVFLFVRKRNANRRVRSEERRRTLNRPDEPNAIEAEAIDAWDADTATESGEEGQQPKDGSR